jgi:hypothetical protein
MLCIAARRLHCLYELCLNIAKTKRLEGAASAKLISSYFNRAGIAISCNLRVDAIQALLCPHKSRYTNHRLVPEHADFYLGSILEGGSHRRHPFFYKEEVLDWTAGKFNLVLELECDPAKTESFNDLRIQSFQKSVPKRVSVQGKPHSGNERDLGAEREGVFAARFCSFVNIRPCRITNMELLIRCKIDFVPTRGDGRKAPYADGVVCSIGIMSVGETAAYIGHRQPLFWERLHSTSMGYLMSELYCSVRCSPDRGHSATRTLGGLLLAHSSLTGITCSEVASRLGLKLSNSSAT